MTEAVVARARAQLKAGMLMGLEGASNRAERIARLLSIHGRVPEVEEVVAKIDAVGVAEVRAFAERMTTSGAALALYGPVEAAPGLEAIRERLAR